MTRTAYGRDEIYTRMAWDSLGDWRWLSERSGLPIFHPLGVLFFFARQEPYVKETLEVHRRLNLSTEALDHAALKKRFPQVDWSGIEIGLYEPQLGALMARRAVQTLMREFVLAGGEYRLASVVPPAAGKPDSRCHRRRRTLNAERFAFACGPWLPKLFPQLLGPRIFPTRQEVFFFAPPAGDQRFSPGQLPGWADFNNGDIFYGFPDLEGRGFKIAHDQHGPAIDPDVGDRQFSPGALAEVRDYMQRRFPALKGRPVVESRRLPVREQLQRRSAHRPAPRMGKRLVARRRLRPWVQARSRRRTARSRPDHRQTRDDRTALHAGEQRGSAESRGALTAAPDTSGRRA